MYQWMGDQISRLVWVVRSPPRPPLSSLTETEVQVSKDDQSVAGMLGYNYHQPRPLLPIFKGDHSLASESISPSDQQHDYPIGEDLTQPLAESLDSLLDLDLSTLSRLTDVPPPLSLPTMDRLFSSNGHDPGNLVTCFWEDDRFDN